MRAKKPRQQAPILTAWHAQLIRLAVMCFRDGHLPRAGGVLDQEPETMDLLWAIRTSPLWEALELG